MEVRRERRVREETVRVELVTEVLVITAKECGPSVLHDGLPLSPGESREIIIYQKTADLGKQVMVTQEVVVFKDRHVRESSEPFELAYEEVVVTRISATGGTADDPINERLEQLKEKAKEARRQTEDEASGQAIKAAVKGQAQVIKLLIAQQVELTALCLKMSLVWAVPAPKAAFRGVSCSWLEVRTPCTASVQKSISG